VRENYGSIQHSVDIILIEPLRENINIKFIEMRRNAALTVSLEAALKMKKRKFQSVALGMGVAK